VAKAALTSRDTDPVVRRLASMCSRCDMAVLPG
jgi:hypothetical protein